MANWLDLTRKVYTRLRRPSQDALPWETVIEKLADVISRLKLDLVLSPQNAQAKVSRWFTPRTTDIALSELGFNVMMPIRMETRSIDSELEFGSPVPIVSMTVLDTSIVGAVAFYDEPMRLAFRDELDYVTAQEYRLTYESDFDDNVALDQIVGLPAFFEQLVVVLTCFELLTLVDDNAPEWTGFVNMVGGLWPAEISTKMEQWGRYVSMFKGRAQVPKRTLFQNMRRPVKSNFFRG